MKKILLSLSLAFMACTLQAASFGTVKWTKNVEAFSLADKAVRSAPVAVSSDGSTYVAGSFNTDMLFGTTILSNVATSAFIGKYDAEGHELWAVAMKGAARITAITADGNGNVYAVGTFAKEVKLTSTGNNPEVTINGKEGDDSRSSFFMVKYDKDGKLLAHQVVVPKVKDEIAQSGMLLEDPEATFFRSNKVMWVDNRLYFSAEYTGESSFGGKSLVANYFFFGNFMYVNIPCMGVYSVDASNLGNLKEELALTYDNEGAENMTRPESVNFTVADGKLYAAFVATGKVKLTSPNKTETFTFGEGNGKREHGFIFSEVSGTTTFSTPFHSAFTDVETNYNLLGAMTFDKDNVYVAGTFNQPAVFGVNKTFKGGSDVFVAAFNRSTNAVRWVTTSGFDDGDNKKNREVLVGMSAVNGKMVVAAYAEETTEHKPQTALVYTLSSNGALTKGNDSFVYGLGNNHNTIVTSTVNGTTITYTAFDADETTGVRTVADDAVVTRQGDVFSFSRALDAQVYNLQGALLLNQKGTRSLSVATLPQGVYVLKAGANKQKFVK